ncbi:MAG: iron-containing redox enzyme family protein [Steroidobacteraceae bacterium]|nr:iron-containing redox enzyme family protein [Steroidobacteraceae bacterium]
MTHFEQLQHFTRVEREALHTLPIICRALAGQITRKTYLAFLAEAYHHVRHTVPLLMAVGSRLTTRQRWLQEHVVRYLEEEVGHDEWILSDIRAAGGDPNQVREGTPGIATDAMVAYAYDTVMRREPTGFFGMVFVLEGTSVALALSAASALQESLKLPDNACTYLRSHGTLDQQHVGDLEAIINRLDPAREFRAVATCARTIYWLYANMLRELDSAQLPHTAEMAARGPACA